MSVLTSADVLNFNRVDLDILVSDVLDSTPFLQRAAARTVASNNFQYTKQLTNPSVGYRDINDGVANTKASYDKVTLNLKYLDASFYVDIAAAKVDERGQDHIMGIESSTSMPSLLLISPSEKSKQPGKQKVTHNIVSETNTNFGIVFFI